MKRTFILIGTLLGYMFCTHSVTAAIVYSGNIAFPGPSFSVDLNGDGGADFVTSWVLRASGSNGIYYLSYDTETNFDIRYLSNRFYPQYPSSTMPGVKVPLELGVSIGPTAPDELLWSSSSNGGMLTESRNSWDDPIIYSGTWHDINNRYLGFELTSASEIFYGWIQLDTDSSNNIVLVDYAYENLPNTPIISGVTSIPLPPSLVLFGCGLIFMFSTNVINRDGCFGRRFRL
jgi:hypothetical protein